MRHNKKFNHLGRKSNHRKAMLANMANSLIMHKRIETTTAKAKALRLYVEPLITKSKDDTTHSRRVVFSYLQDKEAVTELFREVSPKIMERPGGYTRILKTGTRLGDNADMCIIELVDYNESLLAAKEAKAKPGSRRRRRGGKKIEEAAVTDKKQAATEKETVETAEEVKSEQAEAEVVEETTTAAAQEKVEEVKEEPTAEVTETKEETEAPGASDTEKTEEEKKKDNEG